MTSKAKKSTNKSLNVLSSTQPKSIDSPCHTTKIDWYYYLVPPIVLSFLTLIFYWPSRNYEFQFDDIANIIKHYNIRHHTFWDLFFSSSRWLSFWINSLHYHIGKFSPMTYRLGNIAQHVLIGLMIYYFLLIALKNLKKNSLFKQHACSIALLTSALFMLHPVQTQTISYVIQGQMEGMVTFFMMIMILSFYLATRSKSILVYIPLMFIYLISALCACSSKEIAIVIPVLVLIVDWFFVAQGSGHEIKRRWLFHLFSFSVVFGCFVYYFKPRFFYSIIGLQWTATNNLGNVVTNAPADIITPGAYLISQFKVILHYLGIFLWPFNMSVEYDWTLAKSFFAFDCLVPFLMLIALFLLVIYLLKKNSASLIGFGMLWFFICVLPRSSIVPSSELIADYKTYAASIGWLFLLATGLVICVHWIMQFLPKFQLIQHRLINQGIMTCILAVGLGHATMERNTVWRSSLEFWANMLKNAPGKARVHNNYGVELSQKLKKYEESIPYFKQAIAMDPMYSDPHNNLSVVYGFLGKLDLAIEEMKTSLKINPGYAEGYNNLSAFYLEKKDFVQAEKNINVAINMRKSYGKAYLNRARIYFQQGKIEEAMTDLKTACTKADLDNEFGYRIYGQFALEHKHYDDALFAFQKLADVAPQSADGYIGLGHAHFFMAQYEQARTNFERAFEIDPRNGRIAFNLGEVHYKLNNFAKALSYFERINIFQVPQVGINIAQCYSQLGQLKKAQTTLETILALQLPPDLRASAAAALDCL